MPQQSVHQLYKRLETIGKGAYGSVHKGVHIPTGNVVALKIINLDTEDDDVGDIQREVALLTQLRDAPNVTRYYGCFLDGPRVWIAMEYAEGGSVRTLMKACKDGVIEEKYVVVIVREVLLGLNYLHKSAIIHRDIKAANILITAAGRVMICDFGVSALLVTTTSKRNTLIGTPHWMAPEVAHGAAYDTKADIWSLGIVIYEMIKGNVPNSHIVDQMKLLQMIPRMKPPRLNEGEGSKELRDFVAQCLKESAKERLSADELLKTKLIKSSMKVLVSILKDLIARYEAWVKDGGTRASMVGSLPWEDEENADQPLFSKSFLLGVRYSPFASDHFGRTIILHRPFLRQRVLYCQTSDLQSPSYPSHVV
ncbi:Pkinase-domain-containing protein [Panus rudis PR-1116 ss-1]|nr:Pkinase-domain-containing protein [Panus rudis PR-1116 ss-1]